MISGVFNTIFIVESGPTPEEQYNSQKLEKALVVQRLKREVISQHCWALYRN